MTRTGLSSAPDETSIQLAEYVCGLLKSEEHAQIHVLLSRDDQALAVALAWEERLLALVDALPREQPDPALRKRLQRTLGIGPAPAFQPPPQPQLLQRPSVEPTTRPRPATPIADTPSVASSRPTGGGTASSRQPEIADTEKPATPTAQTPAATPAPNTPPTVASGTVPPKPLPSTTQRTARPSATDPGANKKNSVKHEPTQAQVTQASAQATETQHPHHADDLPATQRHQALLRKLWFWRLVTLCATTAAVLAFIMPGEPPPPPVQIVKLAPTRAAILQAPGTSSTPGWSATLDPQGNLMLQPLVPTEVPAGHQVLLWTRSATLPTPRLLGRIDPNRAVQVPSEQLGVLADDQLLEITLETDADAAQGQPNGPILFIGQMIMFGADPKAVPGTGGNGRAPVAEGSTDAPPR